MQALLFNVATLIGVLVMFAGAWLVFGIGIALLIAGAGIWLSAMLELGITYPRRG